MNPKRERKKERERERKWVSEWDSENEGDRDRERGLEVISLKYSDQTIYRQSDSMGISLQNSMKGIMSSKCSNKKKNLDNTIRWKGIK